MCSGIRQLEIHTVKPLGSLRLLSKSLRKDPNISANTIKAVLEQFALRSEKSIIVHIHKRTKKKRIVIISETNHFLPNILLTRLTLIVEKIILDHQCEFRHPRSTTNPIFCIPKTLEKKWE